MARLTVWLLGFEVFSISNEAEPDEDPAAELNGGALGSTPVNMAWRPGQGMDHEPESPYEE